MSNLSYLAKSNLDPAPKKQIIHLPADTSSPIMEDEEEDSGSGSDGEIETKIVTVDTSEDIARNIIKQLINVVIESQSVDGEGDIEDNDKILDNLSHIHKQVFVKVTT